MKRILSVVLAMLMLLSVAAFAEGDYRVAMITDYGDITDQSFNQTTYEACKAFCDANGVDFTYYKPNGDSTAERVAMVEKADDEGYNVIVMPGYAFGETIAEGQEEYPEVSFIALDVSEGDLGGAEVAENVYCAVYKEELCGYMAGYAAVKLGYTHLGFLGGMAVPAVVRYGFGFVQGADAAAAETGADVTVEYVYGNQFYGDADITAYMDNWYQTLGVQCVFACGGGIYSSAAEAAAKVDGGKVIGVDVDQAAIIDGTYGEGGHRGHPADRDHRRQLLQLRRQGRVSGPGGHRARGQLCAAGRLHPVRRWLHRGRLRGSGGQDVQWRDHRV